MLLQQNYKTWITKSKQGVKLLILTKKDGEISVYDQAINFYGSYFDERSFEKMLKKYGIKDLQC